MITLDKASARIGAIEVLRGIDLTVRAGELVAVIGANGAGKTSLLRAASGLLPLTGGDIRYRDASIRGTSAHLLARSGLVHVPQGRQIVPALSVEDNLLIAIKSGVQGENDWSLERVYDMLPLLAPLKDRLGGQLSGGDQQMLTVGRALMGNPNVLLLDEPSEGLAPIMVQKIGDLIEALRKVGTTIVLAEQNLHFCLGLADRAVVIDKGADVFVGTISELNANDDIKQRYLSV